MIHIQKARLSFGSQSLFHDMSVTIAQNQKIGILGRNGMGKSTLLKIIAGSGRFDEGTVTIDRHKTIAYMPQEVVLLSDKTVMEEALTAFEEVVALEKEKKEIEDQLEQGQNDSGLLERYADLNEHNSSFDSAQARARSERILKGLGFTPDMFEKPVTELSVGWKMRLVLAKLLLQDADFYLFDEPTNHLDLPTKEWFFDFLKEGSFGYLLVSHDRHFLDNACNYILALEATETIFYHGNLSGYIQAREQQLEVLHASYERQQKEIARKQATIDRFRASASKAKMAQSMIKQLDKIERIEIEPLLPTVSFSFPATTRPAHIVLSLSHIEHSFDGRTLFRNVEGNVQRGDRIALVAPNGTGKTTLFNLIAGKLPTQNGRIQFGLNVESTLFEQDQLAALKKNNTVYEEVLQAIPGVTEAAIRTFLGCFLFSGDSIHKKISVLSGGERNRVAMVKVLLQKANFLLLDEPTNHLDLYAKDVLLQALKAYQGTLLFVSHDHAFLQEIATSIWELTPSGIHRYPGSYESYLDQKKRSIENSDKPINKEVIKHERSGKESHILRKEIAALETKIERVELEMRRFTENFAYYEYGSAEWKANESSLAHAKKKLADLGDQWETLVSQL